MASTSTSGDAAADAFALAAEELPSLFADDVLSAEELARLLEEDDDDEAEDDSSISCATQSTTSAVAHAIAAAGSLVVGGGKRKLAGRRNSNKARDGRKAELAYLRKSVAELESRLEVLRGASSAAAAGVRTADAGTLASLDARSYFVQEMVPRELPADASSSSRDVVLWREIARRQSDERYRSERENVRLKLVLESQLKVAHSLERFLQLKAAASTTEISKSVDVRRHASLSTLSPASLESAQCATSAACSTTTSRGVTESEEEIYDALLAGVEQMIAEIDTVFEVKGLARAVKSGVNAQLRIDPESGMALEICATKELPFGIHETGAVVWNHYQFAKQRMPHRYYSYNAHKSVDSTDDTIIEDFTLELHAKNTRGRFRTRQMMRRSVSEERYVIVWWSFFDPIELSEERLSGIRFLERGYIMVKKSPAHACTLLQLCLVITPYSAEGDMGGAVGAVTDFMLSSTAANIAAAHQVIENVLLEQALRSSAAAAGGGSDTSASESATDDNELLSIW